MVRAAPAERAASAKPALAAQETSAVRLAVANPTGML